MKALEIEGLCAWPSTGEQDDRNSGFANTAAASCPEECIEKLQQQIISSEMQYFHTVTSKARKEVLRPGQLQLSITARAQKLAEDQHCFSLEQLPLQDGEGSLFLEFQHPKVSIQALEIQASVTCSTL